MGELQAFRSRLDAERAAALPKQPLHQPKQPKVPKTPIQASGVSQDAEGGT